MTSAVGFLFAAFVVIWLGLAGYLFWMASVLRRTRQEIDHLRLRLDEQQASGESPSARTSEQSDAPAATPGAPKLQG